METRRIELNFLRDFFFKIVEGPINRITMSRLVAIMSYPAENLQSFRNWIRNDFDAAPRQYPDVMQGFGRAFAGNLNRLRFHMLAILQRDGTLYSLIHHLIVFIFFGQWQTTCSR